MPINLELHNNHFEVEDEVKLISHTTSHTEYLRYNKYTDASSTLLNYFESDKQTPAKNINLEDLSDKHSKNNIDFIEGRIEEYSGRVFSSIYKDLVITNVLDIDGTPLFYKHKTRWSSEPSIDIISEGEFFNGNESFRYIDGYLYNNFNNSFNYKDESYQLIFVSGEDVNGNSKTEILNNEGAIAELDWRDINIDLLDGVDILSGENGTAKVNSYVRTQTNSGYEYNVIIVENFCDSQKENNIFVKYLNTNSIKLLKPKNINQKDSWFLSVQNGFFFTNRKYFLPEYDNQNFNPEYGIIKHYDKACYLLNKFNNGSILKTDIENICLEPNLGLNITVKILNSSEEILKVYTSESTLIGESYPGDTDLLYEGGIESIDSKNGVIVLEKDIYAKSGRSLLFEEEIKIRADFHNYTKNFQYQKLDLNPLFNEDILNYKYFFYLRPDRDFKESVFYLKVNYRNEIEDSNDVDLHNHDDVGDRENILKLSLNEFKSQFCHGGQNDFEFLELGEVFYKEASYIDEATLFDIRDKTAINEETFDDYVYRQHKVLQSDLGYGEDGQTYQDNNIIYITLPKTLLKDFNGDYTEEEIFNLLKTKGTTALDMIFNWEDKKPKLKILPYTNLYIERQNVAPSTNKIKIKFSFEGPGEYVLYKFEDLNAFDQSNADLQIVNLSITQAQAEAAIRNKGESLSLLDKDYFFDHEDTLLEYSKIYYYKIVYNEIYKSDTVSFKTREESTT